MQRWTNVCTNFSPKKWGSGGRVPLSKSGGRRPPRPSSTTSLVLRSTDEYVHSATTRRPSKVWSTTSTIDLPRRNFLSPDLGQSSREKCVYFVGRACPDFFSYNTELERSKEAPVPKISSIRSSVSNFRQNADLRQTQSHEPWLVPRSLMAYRGKNRPCGSIDSAMRILLHFAPPRDTKQPRQ